MNKEKSGIPQNAFNNIGESTILGLNSGKQLSLEVKPNSILLTDPGDERYYFFAEVNNGIVEFNIRTADTTDDQTEKHPDMFARDLVSMAFDFFQRNNISITSWKALWLSDRAEKPSTNWITFQDQLTDTDHPKMEEMKKAAKQTWTGKLATEFGFTEVASVEILYPNNISVCFVKPQTD